MPSENHGLKTSDGKTHLAIAGTVSLMQLVSGGNHVHHGQLDHADQGVGDAAGREQAPGRLREAEGDGKGVPIDREWSFAVSMVLLLLRPKYRAESEQFAGCRFTRRSYQGTRIGSRPRRRR